jgi:hypothetical protein
MPRKFEACRRSGGRIRVVKPKGRCNPLYIPICWMPGGRSIAGEPRYASKVPQDCGKRRRR